MILLNNTVDITDIVEPVTQDGAEYSDIFGVIAKRRDYVLRDQRGRYNPFSPGSYFARNPFRATPIRETDENGAILFDGQIYDVQPQDTGSKRTVVLNCRDPFGVLLDWPVNLCDLDTYSGWKVSANTSSGSTTVVLAAITGTPNDPPVGSTISFNDDYSPSYRITNFNSGTDTATLDRAIVESLTINTVCNIAVPTLETPAAAIKRALVSAGIGARCDSSFDVIDLADQTAGLYLWFFIQPANKIKLREFVSLVMELGDIYLSVSQTGVISARRGLFRPSGVNLRSVTPSELIAPSQGPYYDTTRLIYAYNVIYTAPATSISVGGLTVALTGEAKLISNQVDSTTLDDFAAADVWKPIQPASADLREYTILYGDENTARYFGNSRLSYFGVGRPRFRASLKRAESGNPARKYSVALFDDFLLTVPVAQGETLGPVHAVVVGYNYNFQTRKYDSVEFEITNGASAAALGTVASSSLLTEDGDALLTEDGEFILLES